MKVKITYQCANCKGINDERIEHTNGTLFDACVTFARDISAHKCTPLVVGIMRVVAIAHFE